FQPQEEGPVYSYLSRGALRRSVDTTGCVHGPADGLGAAGRSQTRIRSRLGGTTMPYGAADMTEIMGIGSYLGGLRRGPDGNLYEWVEGVDGLGNPIGFWRKAFSFVKSAAQAVARGALSRLIPGPIKRIARRVCGAVDQIGPVVSVIPPVAPFYAGAQ